MRNSLLTGLLAVLCLAAFASLSDAQQMDKMASDEKTKPVVAIISAEWCPYCKNVEPVMMKLMKEYGEKLNFVVFDVTSDGSSKKAMMQAEKLGLSDFFKDHKRKTSTVAVIKEDKIVFKTSNNTKREDYLKAFDSVLK